MPPIRTSIRPAPLLVALWLAIPSSALAQADDTRHSIGLALDFGVGQLRETLMSSQRYDGLLPGAELRYSVARGPHHHAWWFGALVGTLTDRYDTTLLDAQIDAGYAYRHDVLSVDGWTVAVGGALDANPNVHHYGEVDSDHIYWRTRYALQALGSAEHRWPAGTTLAFGLTVDLLGLVSRPPAYRMYNNDLPDAGSILAKAHEDLEIASFDSLVHVALDTRVVFAVRDWHRQAIGLELAYSRYAEPEVAESLDVLLEYGFLFDW